MIASMRHVTIITTASRRRLALAQLRELGVMHIAAESAKDEVVPELRRRIENFRRALQIAVEYQSGKRAFPSPKQPEISKEYHYSLPTAEAAATAIVHQERLLMKYREQEMHINRQLESLKVWGGYSQPICDWLEEHGIHCSCYILNKQQYQSLPRDSALLIKRQSGSWYVLQIRSATEKQWPFTPHPMPNCDSRELRGQLPELQQRAHKALQQLLHLLSNIPLIKIAYQRLLELNEITQTRHRLNWDGTLIYLRGFVPATDIATLKKRATRLGWGLLIRRPLQDESVPTKIENTSLVSIVHPLLSLLGTVPDYREPDISALFLLFFVLFFAIIIGDAGYALLLALSSLLLLFYARRKGQRQALQSAKLLLLCSAVTLLWGTLSGNWFGAPEIAERSWLRHLIIPQLNSFSPHSIPFVQWFCFIVAAMHLGIAHIWRALLVLRKRQWLLAVAQLGWLLMVLALYSLVVRLILGLYNFWYLRNYPHLLLLGILIVVLCAQQEGVSFGRGVVRGLKSLFNTFLEGISAFADIISYLRLFAVGLASVEIAHSFNQLAFNVGAGATGWVGAVIVIIIGHTLNIALGALALIVHGVRLNMLEFSSHLGVEWSGLRYQPFSKVQ